jgi:CubicO group peptidase (beta-lactamase class C family)
VKTMLEWTFALLWLAFAGAAAAAAPPPPHPAFTGIDQLASETIEKWGAPGMAIAIVHNGHVIVSKGYGVRTPGGKAPMNASTIIPIASTTKPFTSLAVGMLMDEGKVNLDLPVSTYVPDFKLHDPVTSANATLRDVLSHRTGVPRHDWLMLYNPAGRVGVIPRLAHLPSSAPLQTRFQYNNMMYAVAARAIDNVAGQPAFGPKQTLTLGCRDIVPARDRERADKYDLDRP